jgi:hypothetical protein
LVNDTNTGKMVPNEHKMYPMFKKSQMVKNINIFQYKALQNLPKLGFLV